MSYQKFPHLVLFYWVAFSCALWCHGEVVRIKITSCLNTSAAVWVSGQTSRSIRDCLWFSRDPLAAVQTSIGLVQFNSMSKSCAVYRFKDVCHQLNLTAEQKQSLMLGQTCETLIDVAYDVLTANAHFAAVWLGGYGPALENIVCGPAGLRNPVTASNIEWTSSGAQMNGVNSSLLVTDATGFNFSSGFTMIVEVKRNIGPKYCFMELTDCSSFDSISARLWESQYVGQINLKPVTSKIQIQTQPYTMTNNSAEFFKMAVAFDSVANLTKFYLGSAALPDQSLQWAPYDNPISIVPGINCVKIGFRSSSSGYGVLNGTVKMAAIANSYLPEDVVLRFLSGN